MIYNGDLLPCDVGWAKRTLYLICWWLGNPGCLPLLSLLTGMKTTVSEAEHPLLCEGTRREKGDLALALMITYKDDQAKLKKVRD